MAYSREYYEATKEKIRERNKNYYLKIRINSAVILKSGKRITRKK